MPRKTNTPKLTDPKLETDAKYSLAEHVRDTLREAIASGEYAPGQRIRESDIADRLQVSRTPVREGLRQLEADGLLVFEPWRGVIVAELNNQQIVELYKVRAALEGLAARNAAKHMDESEIEVMSHLVARAGKEKDVRNLAALNKQFHEIIYSASHNRYLIKTIQSLRSPLSLLQGTTYSIADRAREAQAEHAELLEAIRKRDGDLADEIAQRHLKGAEVARLRMMAGLG